MTNFSNLQIIKNHNNQSLEELIKQKFVPGNQAAMLNSIVSQGSIFNIPWNTQEIKEVTRIEEWYECHGSQKALLFLHGFAAEHTAKHDWHPHMKKIGQKYNCSVYALIWPTNIMYSRFAIDVFDLLFFPTALIKLLSLKIDFVNAVTMADLISKHMHEIIMNIPDAKDIFLIGHSLGGRIVLNTTSKPSERIKGGLALAPAISQYELELPVLDSLFTYSEHDWILKNLYPVAKESTNDQHKGNEIAVGYAGCNRQELEINLNHLEMGHLDYSKDKFKEVLKNKKIKHFLQTHLTNR